MRMLAVWCVAAVLAGCATAGTEVRPDQLSTLRAGQTTYAEVVQLLGPPNGNAIHADGTRKIAYVRTSASPLSASQSVVTMTFDQRGVLIAVPPAP